LKATILYGHVLDRLKQLPDESVQCVVTSPPYWGLRDYGIPAQVWGGELGCEHNFALDALPTETGKGNWAQGTNGRGELQPGGVDVKREPLRATAKVGFCIHCGAWQGCLGLEPTPELFIQHTVQVFREARRVLRKDGTLWLNIGDSYAISPPGCGKDGVSRSSTLHGVVSEAYRDTLRSSVGQKMNTVVGVLKPKDLVGIPWMLAFALRADGWWLRQDIIWSKPNPMPESVTDRCTKAHEYLFLLTKSATYYCDMEAIKEPCQSGPSDIRKMEESLPRIGGKHKDLIDPLCMASSTTNIGQKRSVGGTRACIYRTHIKARCRAAMMGPVKTDAAKVLAAAFAVHGNLPGRDDGGAACNDPHQLFRNKRSVWDHRHSALQRGPLRHLPGSPGRAVHPGGNKAGRCRPRSLRRLRHHRRRSPALRPQLHRH
jgi:DNA modification methylase